STSWIGNRNHPLFLKLKYRECWCSLMYYVKGWDIKLHSQKLKEIVHKAEDYVPNFILIND
ncbi:hypothetical protein ACRCLA_19640, partial [Acinetobacter baumannii]